MKQLPIDPVLPDLQRILRSAANAVLVAPPGAGKTTRVPLALLNEPWLMDQRIIMLEPRRLAARSAARHMAASLGERVGETVGYRVRLDTKVGPRTRIEVITEGVLTRLLQEDPALEGVGVIIFDEFHERSLHADLGLALCLQTQQVLREDLRIVVMSATIEAEPVANLLGSAPIVRSEGRSFPVQTHYLDRPSDERLEHLTVRSVLHALQHDPGDMLVFLPGAAEIRRVEARLHELRLGNHVRIAPLFGVLPQGEQDAALAPCGPGERKIVLATSIAETSLTVEGVRIVIDSGLMRVPRFSPRTGMSRLETIRVSRASADQRRGRAGRLDSGVCYRLWTVQEDRSLKEQSTPEILEADLTALALELAAWGVTDPSELQWLDPPPTAAMTHARELLRRLGAMDERGVITSHGRSLAEWGLHPRFAHMLVNAVPLKQTKLACMIAAVLGERDFMRKDTGTADADLRVRVEAIHKFALAIPSKQSASGRHSIEHEDSPTDVGRDMNYLGWTMPGYSVDAASCRRIAAEARHIQESVPLSDQEPEMDIHSIGLLLAFAYPDRIAQRRTDGRYLLSNGRGAILPDSGSQAISVSPFLVAADLDDRGSESRIYLASPVDLGQLEDHCQQLMKQEKSVEWDREAGRVRAVARLKLGALVLKEQPVASPAPEELLTALLQGIADEGLEILPWTRAARQVQQRAYFMHCADSSWPDLSDEALLDSLEQWLGPHLYGLKSRNDLARLGLTDILEAMLTWEQRRELDASVPTHITVPSGSRIAVDYSDPASPVLSVRLQEMFGLQDTPRIAKGTIPITLHLLSPAQRPVQVTKDLASFWQNAYFEVKKDLKGRYPKHYWPDDPLAAMPTNRAKPRN
ncbi:ATP-dependent helicase HrpB [Paenibacillus allorhizosphaerae]|nr:ATP-dependent helicase HrpB [Paenibacillus allorhizosphaerae]